MFCICLVSIKCLGYRFAGSLFLRLAYGYQVDDENDPLISLADEAVDIFVKASAPGAFLVDFIPICMCIHGILYIWNCDLAL